MYSKKNNLPFYPPFYGVITRILPALALILLALYALYLVAGLGCKRGVQRYQTKKKSVKMRDCVNIIE
jgi:hypothetical protein